MINNLIIIGLSTIPFIMFSGDLRWSKETVAIVIASLIGIWGIYKGELKPISNPILLMIPLSLWATTQTPLTGLALGDVHSGRFMIERVYVDNLWNYKPILFWLVYLLMVSAIAGAKLKDFKIYFTIMAWAGAIVAIAVILNHLGFHQFTAPRPVELVGTIKHPEIVAFIGQSTLCAAFLMICLLPCFYIRNYWLAILTAVGILVCTSTLAYIALILALILIIFIYTDNKWILLAIPMSLIFMSACIYAFHIPDEGRFTAWLTILNDVRNPLFGGQQSFGMTGYGAGSFPYVFRLIHNTHWGQAHNEYLEFLFNNGAAGLIILLTSIGLFIKDCLKRSYDEEIRYLLSIFIISCVLTCGTFIWQLAVGSFYIAVVVGLAYNRINALNAKPFESHA